MTHKKTVFIFIFILLFLLITILFIYINKLLIKSKYEHYNYNDNIFFIKNNDLCDILIANNDNYHNTFFYNDYVSRNIKNMEEYHQYIKKSTYDFNKIQIKKIKNAITKADIFFKSFKTSWFDGNRACALPWKLGCVRGKLYENGLPHTRDDIIIISNDDVDNYSENKLIKTLIHEKIHIYQKAFPNDIKNFIKENKYSLYKKRENIDNIRANPDLDNYIYLDSNNEINCARYNDNPKNIEDIKYVPLNNQSYEHPYEKMAIEIENYYK